MALLNTVDPIGYSSTRNFVDGAVTYLSPYISRGVISGKQVADSLPARGFAPVSTQKLLQELAWREYFQRVWQHTGDLLFTDLRQPQSQVRHRSMIKAVTTGTTGINAIDTAIHRFYGTGYIHNHVRMYIASIACNIGGAHWLMPARWMYAHLLDGDLASNMCSWQWVVGTFSNKKYYCNQDNINSHTRSDQRNTFLDVDAKLLPDCVLPPSLATTIEWELRTPMPLVAQPVVDVSKPTLVYNSYNLDPNWRRFESVNRVLLLEPSHFEKFSVSENVLDFIIALAQNIRGIQLMVGEITELTALYRDSNIHHSIISKEHPAFMHYPGIKDQREWMYPSVDGYFNSFSSFWKACKQAESNAWM